MDQQLRDSLARTAALVSLDGLTGLAIDGLSIIFCVDRGLLKDSELRSFALHLPLAVRTLQVA